MAPSKEDLRAEYQNLLLEGLGACGGNHDDMQNIFKTFQDHVRTEEKQEEIKKIVYVRKPTSGGFMSKKGFITKVAVPVLLAMVAMYVFPVIPETIHEYIVNTECLIDNNILLTEMGREVFNCEVCKHMKEVPIAYNLTREDFEKKYAYTFSPVLVKQATTNWSAIGTFSFKYFQKLYLEADEKRNKLSEESEEEPDGELTCQFFPYNTEFADLVEAMGMSDERATFQPGEKPWYFGWSNCDKDIQQELRKRYNRPHFLPPDSEAVPVDWIFMGGSGKGAPLHLDYVSRPSWQAQISGVKTWTLTPVPECQNICHSMNVTVHAGDIIVVDTNHWYHSTYVHPGEISIVIGSEYD